MILKTVVVLPISCDTTRSGVPLGLSFDKEKTFRQDVICGWCSGIAQMTA
jgi:hypothetical protein